jgi:hypothetical protein
MLLSVERLQSAVDIAPPTLLLGQRHHAGEVRFGEPLALLAEGGTTTAQIGLASLQLLRQPVPPTRPLHRVCNHLGCCEHCAQVTPDRFL